MRKREKEGEKMSSRRQTQAAENKTIIYERLFHSLSFSHSLLQAAYSQTIVRFLVVGSFSSARDAKKDPKERETEEWRKWDEDERGMKLMRPRYMGFKRKM